LKPDGGSMGAISQADQRGPHGEHTGAGAGW
jgi:hypothetical protein